MNSQLRPALVGAAIGAGTALLGLLNLTLNNGLESVSQLRVPDFSYQDSKHETKTDEILQLFAKYKKDLVGQSTPAESQPAPEVSYSLTAEQEAAQQGRMQQLRSGEFSYQLTGIFKEQSRFAVLKIVNLRTGGTDAKKVETGTSLDGYQVTQISHRSVTMQKAGQTVELVMFKAIQKENR